MHTSSVWIGALALLTPVVSAQTTDTLPKGFMSTVGNTSFHPGFDSAPTYNPARCVSSYGAATFPASIANGGAITKLGMRADDVVAGQIAHTKDWRIYMSTDGFAPNRPRFMLYAPETVHGANKKLVVGTVAAPKTISFPAGVGTGIQSFFDIFLDAPMVVPAGAKNLIVDIRSYKTNATTGSWRCDAQTVTATLDRGTYATYGTACPTTLTGLNSYINWPGGDLYSWINTLLQNKPVVALWGARLATSIPLPPSCFMHVNPLLIAVGTSDNTANGMAGFYWGAVPNDETLIGAKWTVQYGVVNTGYPYLGTIGTSNAAEHGIGSGWPAATVSTGSVYHYGAAAVPNPDTVTAAAYLATTVPILRVN